MGASWLTLCVCAVPWNQSWQARSPPSHVHNSLSSSSIEWFTTAVATPHRAHSPPVTLPMLRRYTQACGQGEFNTLRPKPHPRRPLFTIPVRSLPCFRQLHANPVAGAQHTCTSRPCSVSASCMLEEPLHPWSEISGRSRSMPQTLAGGTTYLR